MSPYDCIAEGRDLGPGQCSDIDCPGSEAPPAATPREIATQADATAWLGSIVDGLSAAFNAAIVQLVGLPMRDALATFHYTLDDGPPANRHERRKRAARERHAPHARRSDSRSYRRDRKRGRIAPRRGGR